MYYSENKRIKDMSFGELKEVNTYHLMTTEKSRRIKQLLEENNILTEDEKIKVLFIWSRANRYGRKNFEIKEIAESFYYSRMGNLRQSLYNVMFINKNNKKGLVTTSKVADYKNLIANGLAYTKQQNIVVKDDDYMVDKGVSFKVLILTPLAYVMYDSIEDRGQAIIDKEVNRLQRMGAI